MIRNIFTKKSFIFGAAPILFLIIGAGLGVMFFSHHSYQHDHHDDHHAGHMGKMHAGSHMQHDEENMPMLNGKDTSALEVDELKALFMNHEKLKRSVELLPNGIKTITETDDAELAAFLIGHAAGMIARVSEGRNPHIPIQSDTLQPLFEGGQNIVTEIETTPKGIIVIQTSDDLSLVKALQTHAQEVSDLAARGMEAVHEQMMKRQ